MLGRLAVPAMLGSMEEEEGEEVSNCRAESLGSALVSLTLDWTQVPLFFYP